MLKKSIKKMYGKKGQAMAILGMIVMLKSNIG
jgi:hypothetical protein